MDSRSCLLRIRFDRSSYVRETRGRPRQDARRHRSSLCLPVPFLLVPARPKVCLCWVVLFRSLVFTVSSLYYGTKKAAGLTAFVGWVAIPPFGLFSLPSWDRCPRLSYLYICNTEGGENSSSRSLDPCISSTCCCPIPFPTLQRLHMTTSTPSLHYPIYTHMHTCNLPLIKSAAPLPSRRQEGYPPIRPLAASVAHSNHPVPPYTHIYPQKRPSGHHARTVVVVRNMLSICV